MMADPESTSTRVSVRRVDSIRMELFSPIRRNTPGVKQDLRAAVFGAKLLVLFDVGKLAEFRLNRLVGEKGMALHVLDDARMG